MGFAEQNQRYVGLSGAKSIGDRGLRHCAGEASDLSCLFMGEKLLEVRDQASVDGVLLVGSVVGPFQVYRSAVGFHPIDVIYQRKAVGIGHKGCSHQSMDMDGLAPSVVPQDDLRISVPVESRPEDLSVASLRPVGAASNSIEASYTAEITDFVQFTEFGNGDATPFFDEHSVGLLAWGSHGIAPLCAHQGD